MFVYPRLPDHIAQELADEFAGIPVEELRDRGALEHEAATYYPTGTRVDRDTLAELAHDVCGLIDDLGFPEPKSKEAAYREFDQTLPGVIHARMSITPADAAHESVWSFLSLVLVPEVAPWRYPERSSERILGKPRNALRRLWWRAEMLGSGPDDPPATLGEDQLVAVMERPTIGGDSATARSLCASVRRAAEANPAVSAMFLMRDAAKRLTRLTPFIAPQALSDGQLKHVTDELADQATAALVAPLSQTT